jgi:hypothetical protein
MNIIRHASILGPPPITETLLLRKFTTDFKIDLQQHLECLSQQAHIHAYVNDAFELRYKTFMGLPRYADLTRCFDRPSVVTPCSPALFHRAC